MIQNETLYKKIQKFKGERVIWRTYRFMREYRF